MAERIGRGLKDLEVLIPDPYLVERYGVFTWRNSRQALLRGLVRQLLFNPITVPLVRRWLDRPAHHSPLNRWMYWKVLIYHVNRGYHQAPRRAIRALETLPPRPGPEEAGA